MREGGGVRDPTADVLHRDSAAVTRDSITLNLFTKRILRFCIVLIELTCMFVVRTCV